MSPGEDGSFRHLQAGGSNLSVGLAGDAAWDDRAVVWGSHTIQLDHVGYGVRLGPSKVWGGNRDAEKKLLLLLLLLLFPFIFICSEFCHTLK